MMASVEEKKRVWQSLGAITFDTVSPRPVTALGVRFLALSSAVALLDILFSSVNTRQNVRPYTSQGRDV